MKTYCTHSCIYALTAEHASFKIHVGVHLMFAYKFQYVSFKMGPLLGMCLTFF